MAGPLSATTATALSSRPIFQRSAFSLLFFFFLVFEGDGDLGVVAAAPAELSEGFAGATTAGVSVGSIDLATRMPLGPR